MKRLADGISRDRQEMEMRDKKKKTNLATNGEDGGVKGPAKYRLSRPLVTMIAHMRSACMLQAFRGKRKGSISGAN